MTPGTPQDQFLARLLSGPLTSELSTELDTWLREDKSHPELLAQFILLEDMLVAARKESAATSVLELLLEMEENADPITVTHLPAPPASGRILAFTQQSSVRWFALAAAILMCVSAGLWGLSLLFTGSQSTAPEITENTDDSTDPGITPQTTPQGLFVATLTAEHDAQWTEGALAPGSQLRADQTLTLTAGFAEITTNDGAIAILEAPATIELLDNDNAIRLHAGKLVGVVETESAKGFLVRAPHMDITDLGTVFGVRVDGQQSTDVHVFEGDVRADWINGAGTQEQVHLVNGQGIRVLASGEAAKPISVDALAFVTSIEATPGTATKPTEHTESVVFYPEMPETFNGEKTVTGASIFLYAERPSFELDREITLYHTEPGTYAAKIVRGEQIVPGSGEEIVSKGTAARSYLIHFNPRDEEQGYIDATGEITFPGRIIGVIPTGELLGSTHPALRAPDTDYVGGPPALGLEAAPTINRFDSFTISEDRKTLALTLHTSKVGIDQVRVLVEIEPGDEP